MPIEINELFVRVKVNEQSSQPPLAGSGASLSTAEQSENNPSIQQVKKSVEAILDILKRKNER